MRDDLHHTVPVNRAWKSAIRVAARAPSLRTELGTCIANAVSLSVKHGIGRDFIAQAALALKPARDDFFAATKYADAINAIERHATTLQQRELCETVRGVLALHPHEQNPLAVAFRQFCIAQVEREVEHVVAKTRETAGADQALELRRRLRTAALDCNFGPDLLTQKRPAARNNEGILDEHFELLDVK